MITVIFVIRRKGGLKKMHQTLRPFELFETEKVEEAIEILTSYNGKAKVLAGGLDLISKMRRWQSNPEVLVCIQMIRELDYMKNHEKGGFAVGALTTLRSMELSSLIRDEYPFLYEAIHQIASVQVKTMGTVVGNLCAATPASDVAPPLITLGAELNISGPDGGRTVLLEDFYLGVEKTVLRPDEIVTEISVPGVPPGSGGAFLKMAHTAACIAKINVAVLVTVSDGVCRDARIALGAVAPTVIRATEAEEILKGNEFDTKTIARGSKAAVGQTNPISDLRSSAEYRKEMVEVLVRRGIEKALERSKAE